MATRTELAAVRRLALAASMALLVGCDGSAPDASPSPTVSPSASPTVSPSASPSARPGTPATSPAPDGTAAPDQIAPTGPTPSPPSDSADAHVVSVSDGDTLQVRVDGAVERVRLIGINAPESDECFGDEARDALADLVAGEDVSLVQDVSARDQFGRLLAYVFVDGLHVNAELVLDGFAIAREYPPDTARADELAAAQREAQDAGAGMWGPDGCMSQRGDVSVSLSVHPDAPGDDNTNLNGEWVDIRNDGDATLELAEWKIKDESASHRYRFPGGTSVAPGGSIRLYTGCGEDRPTERYWCKSRSAVWNNGGDTAFLLDPDGRTVATTSY